MAKSNPNKKDDGHAISVAKKEINSQTISHLLENRKVQSWRLPHKIPLTGTPHKHATRVSYATIDLKQTKFKKSTVTANQTSSNHKGVLILSAY